MRLKKRIRYCDWMQLWIHQRQADIDQGKGKQSSQGTYISHAIRRILPVFGNYYVDEITESMVEKQAYDWCNPKDHTKPLSKKTIRDIISTIKSSIKAAYKAGYRAAPLDTIRIPQTFEQKKRKVFSTQDARKLVQYIYLNICPEMLGYLICLCTGLRIGEICALTWENIHLEREIICIKSTMARLYRRNIGEESGWTEIVITSPKSERSVRSIPISSLLLPALEKMKIENPRAFVITGTENPMEPQTYRKHFYKFLKQINIDKVCFHGLRHTFATTLIAGGAE